jgi:nucleoside-diphosphate-sugar epimerase
MRRDVPGCPPIGYALADVRDVAAAHIAAMDAPQAAGKRFIVATDHVWLRDIALALDAHLKDKGYKIPTRALPAFVLRLVGMYDKTAKLAVPEINLRMDLSRERATRILNWEPRSPETTVTDMADSFIEFNVA